MLSGVGNLFAALRHVTLFRRGTWPKKISDYVPGNVTTLNSKSINNNPEKYGETKPVKGYLRDSVNARNTKDN